MDTAAAARREDVELEEYLAKLHQSIVSYVAENQLPDTSVNNPDALNPTQLRRMFDFSIPDHASSTEEIITGFKETLKYSTRTGNPKFLNKLYAGTTPVGCISELIATVLNANVHVYHVSPVFTLMEIAVIEKLCRTMGFKDGFGLLCPGGSYSNMLAMITARNKLFPELKQRGMWGGPRLAVFTSAHSHYSIDKAAQTIGIGSDFVFKVPTDESGAMRPEALDAMMSDCVAKGITPFFVNATSGTTVTAAFDPLVEIHAVASKHRVWLHVDGSWGGPVIFSKKWRHLVRGVELADSFTINPHKLLGVPLQCSALLTRDRFVLRNVNSLKAKYLFHDTEETDSLDMGDGSIGCGRKPDGFKLFMSWRRYGSEGFERRVDNAFELARHLADLVSKHPRMRLAVSSVTITVCFWFVPSEADGVFDSEAAIERMSTLTHSIQHLVNASGRFSIDFAPLRHPTPQPDVFRIPLKSPNVTRAHLEELVNLIDAHGQMLTANDGH